MHRLVLVALPALFLVPLSPAAAACNGDITELIVEDGSPGGQGFYIDDRSTDEVAINFWTYMEDNGREGLQSGGDVSHWPFPEKCSFGPACIPFYLSDPCYNHHEWGNSDLLIL